MISMKAYLNAAEVAKLLNVNRATVTRWIRKGIIKNAVQIGETHQWRIPLASYEEIVRERNHESH